MQKENIDKLGVNIVKNITKSVLSDIPVLGSILDIVFGVASDISVENRFELLEIKFGKLADKQDEIIASIKKLDSTDIILLKNSLMDMLVSYNNSAFEKRREYLANAIINTTTLKNNDYQKNTFYMSILNNIPDITIEFIDQWSKRLRNSSVQLNKVDIEFGEENYQRLKKKYRTDIQISSVVKNCIDNGLLDYKEITQNENNLYMNANIIQINNLSYDLLNFIKLRQE
ncbi:hypothetical protein IMAU20120_02762 [Lactiplantibacillus plantarum]|nr:hypothetical protein [Lactiplantibacillus plantarum]MCG0813845.1 hypothetical protein [Lactiplantibacillus plantarum]MCG0879215.1 hypothetical protein [Lactiplantibacillus plantarum]MCG0951712.1 hypothetical protein [Lactiplantibacillus plantarum]